MKKILFISVIIIRIVFLPVLKPEVMAADLIQDDAGIQTIYQDGKIPHLSDEGKIIDKYGSNSIFVKGIYNADLGPYGSDWSKYNLNSTLSRDTLQPIKEAGFNVVIPGHTDGFNTQDLDRVQQFGLKMPAIAYSAVVAMHSSPAGSYHWPILEASISAVMNHPALFGYYLYDESPNGTQYAWRMIYNRIKAMDPKHIQFPLSALDFVPKDNLVTTDCMRDNVDYRPLSDVFVTDIYTIHTNTKSLLELTRDIDAAVRSCQRKTDGSLRPFILVYPAYQRYTVHSGNPDIDEILPTENQLRGQIYASIIHGAVGTFVYTMHSPWQWERAYNTTYNDKGVFMNGISPEMTPDLWNAVSKANREINTYMDVILAKTATDTYHVSHTQTGISEHPLHAILKDTGEKDVRYLLAINIDGASLSGQFKFEKEILEVKSFLDNRTLAFNGHSFTDPFGENGVRLYRIVFNNTYSCQTKSIGDANCDGKINEADYGIWKEEMKNMTSLYADFNSDGKVNLVDFEIWRRNKG